MMESMPRFARCRAAELSASGAIHIKGAHLVSDRRAVRKVATIGVPGGSQSGCSFLVDVVTGGPVATALLGEPEGA